MNTKAGVPLPDGSGGKSDGKSDDWENISRGKIIIGGDRRSSDMSDSIRRSPDMSDSVRRSGVMFHCH